MTALIAAALLGIRSEQPNPLLRQFEKRYGVRVVYPAAPPFTWSSVALGELAVGDAKNLDRYAFVLSSELSKYPIALVRASGIRALALVKDLQLEGKPVGALPDYKYEILYLDINLHKSQEQYERHVVHHEFFHMLDEQIHKSSFRVDAQWSALNPNGFAYLPEGDKSTALSHPHPGFINNYSMTALEEDKAEIFGALMMEKERSNISKWLKDDTILAAKKSAIADFIKACAPLDDSPYMSRTF